jgi:type I restriction enzyme S subunit
MSSEWREVTLGDFVRLQRGHDLTSSEQRSGTIPVMGSAGKNGNHNVAKWSIHGARALIKGCLLAA